MNWNAELQRKSRTILEDLDNYVAYHHFKFFENVQFGISISVHHILFTASEHKKRLRLMLCRVDKLHP
jgi:hypothetical protein